MIDIPTRKKRMRREVLARVLAMTGNDRGDQETRLLSRFETLPGLTQAGMLLLYVSAFPEEFETRPLLRRALELGKQVACPRVDWDSNQLILFEVLDPELDLAPGRRGIPEPVASCRQVEPFEVDWILVPGLAFDRRGYRLGRGAGHYDNLLPTLRPDATRWSLILDTQWVEEVPVEPHDQPLDGVADAWESHSFIRS